MAGKPGPKPWLRKAVTTPASRHERVVRARGRAAEHKCVDCGGDAKDWSQIHDTCGECIEDYEPRCRRCHQKYDKVVEGVIASNHRRKGESRPYKGWNRVKDPETGLWSWVNPNSQ